MNCYLISYRGKQFATHADNMLEAETKFIETHGEPDEVDFRISHVELTPELRSNELVVWF